MDKEKKNSLPPPFELSLDELTTLPDDMLFGTVCFPLLHMVAARIKVSFFSFHRLQLHAFNQIFLFAKLFLRSYKQPMIKLFAVQPFYPQLPIMPTKEKLWEISLDSLSDVSLSASIFVAGFLRNDWWRFDSGLQNKLSNSALG